MTHPSTHSAGGPYSGKLGGPDWRMAELIGHSVSRGVRLAGSLVGCDSLLSWDRRLSIRGPSGSLKPNAAGEVVSSCGSPLL